MKIREKLAKRLFESGLFEKQAEAVMELFVTTEPGKLMDGRMDDDESDYPPQIMQVLWTGVCKAAIQWMDANCPAHWARPMFDILPREAPQNTSA